MEDGGYDGISATAVDSLAASLWPSPHRDFRLAFLYGGPVGFSFYSALSYLFRTRYFHNYGGRDTENIDDGGRFGTVPASEAEIVSLPRETAGEVREKDCAVCLESFEEGEELRMMTCPSSHGFHENCIFKWLRVSRLCPLCRFVLPVEQKEETYPESDEETETEVEGMDSGVMVEANRSRESHTPSPEHREEEAGACLTTHDV